MLQSQLSKHHMAAANGECRRHGVCQCVLSAPLDYSATAFLRLAPRLAWEKFIFCSRPTTQELGQENRESNGRRELNKFHTSCKARRWNARINFMLLTERLPFDRKSSLWSRYSHEVSAIKAKNAALKRHSCTSSVAVVPIGFRAALAQLRSHVRWIIRTQLLPLRLI